MGGDEIVIAETDHPLLFAGGGLNFPDGIRTITIIITEGSEEFISVAITLTNKNTTTVPHIITETPTTIEMMTITTKLTTFATSTMTIGANTGAAKVDSHLPPSFPPSFPQMPKLALAENQRPQLSFPRLQLSFPRRRESTRRRAANADGAKRHLITGGFAAAN